jgi:poly(3-hydroxybutyrate) depolymerase
MKSCLGPSSNARSAFLALALLSASAQASAPPGPLDAYESLAAADVTVSGVSSGAFFAHQFEVAYSSLVRGAGLVAGGPYGCAERAPWFLAHTPLSSTRAAVAACTQAGKLGWLSHLLTGSPDPRASAELTWREFEHGRIDDPANLRSHRVWIFSGGLDEIVPPATTSAVEAYYEIMGVPRANIRFEERPDAGHGLPVEEFAGKSDYPKRKCRDGEPPYIIDCDRDAAELLFRHLYPGGFRGPAMPRRTHLTPFDQTEFLRGMDPSVSMAATGYVYVPAGCANGAAPRKACRLHVAFHACEQNEESVGDDFYWDGGYNRWAEANDIVVLYPQTIRWAPGSSGNISAGNPAACWDWWGYTGPDYDNQHGKQVTVIRAMIARMRGL